MNMVVCNHYNNNGKFIFKVPENVSIDAGTAVTVETRNGIKQAICVTSSFKADPTVICPLWNTTPENMKRVVSYMQQSYLEWPEDTKTYTITAKGSAGEPQNPNSTVTCKPYPYPASY